jgi:fructokinase
MKPIYCVGSINLDRFLIPNQTPRHFLGGSACNTAHYLSQILPSEQYTVYMVGLIGTDDIANEVRKLLGTRKFSSEYVHTVPGNTGSINVHIGAEGIPTILRQRSVVTDLPDYLELPSTKKALEHQFIHVKGGRRVLETLFKINPNLLSCDISGFLAGEAPDLQVWLLSTFKNRSCTILFGDAIEFTELIRALRPNEPCPDLNQTGVFEQVDPIRECLKQLNAQIACLKQGSVGATVINHNQVFFAPSQKIIPIDTSGAGDSFNAAFLAAYLQGEDLDSALKKAVTLGTANCQVVGSQELEFDPHYKIWKKGHFK